MRAVIEFSDGFSPVVNHIRVEGLVIGELNGHFFITRADAPLLIPQTIPQYM